MKGKVGAIILAAGESRRMAGRDKLFSIIGGKSVMARVVDTFLACTFINRVVVVLSPDKMTLVQRMLVNWPSIEVCPGGKRRQDSVAAGLAKLDDCDWIIIHDGARPLVSKSLIENVLTAADETGAAIAAVPVTDTIKIAEHHLIKKTVPRQGLWAAQTPQVFRADVIREAYRKSDGDVTDDAAMVETSGFKVKICMGFYGNIKITTPEDIIMAETLLEK